jgi:hypothetical protein
MSGQYAADTQVTADRSRAEIEKTLQRYGARQFMYGYDDSQAVVMFAIHERQIRFVLPMPSRESREFTHTPSKGLRRTTDQQLAEYDKAVRQRWRALALVIKAKLEAVETNIVTFDAEFLAHIVMPNGRTVGEEAIEAVQLMYETNQMAPLLTGFDAPRAIAR